MIISHRHRFIFWKPTKVAGTSVEASLAAHCGPDDIVTPQRDFEAAIDHDAFAQVARNFTGFREHMAPQEIRAVVGERTWQSYLKVTIARNPWDYLVSRFRWEYTKMYRAAPARTLLLRARHVLLRAYHGGLRRRYIYSIFSFGSFIRGVPDVFRNHRFYFGDDGSPLYDVALRYERLQEDYEALCARLGLPPATLPRLNSKSRKARRHYSRFYTPDTSALVAEQFRGEIEHFGYRFEPEDAPGGGLRA